MRRIAAATFLATLVASAAAFAQGKVTLRVADVYPAGHFVANYLTKPWMEDVTRRSGGTVEFQYFPAEQLGKGRDLLALTQQGVVDVGLIIPSFTSDKLPLSAVAELPGSFKSGCEGTRAFWSLAREGLLADKEFAPNGIKLLFATVLPPYQIFSRTRVEGVKGFEGLKLYSTGGAKDLTLRRLKAVPVRVSITELYESLSRGTVDGGVMSFATARAYNLPALVRSATLGENFGSGVITYAVSLERWRKLTPAQQGAFAEAGEAVVAAGCAAIDRDVAGDIEKLRAANVNLVQLSDADRREIAESVATVNREWAEDLDRRGKPGREVLDAFASALQRVR